MPESSTAFLYLLISLFMSSCFAAEALFHSPASAFPLPEKVLPYPGDLLPEDLYTSSLLLFSSRVFGKRAALSEKSIAPYRVTVRSSIGDKSDPEDMLVVNTGIRKGREIVPASECCGKRSQSEESFLKVSLIFCFSSSEMLEEANISSKAFLYLFSVILHPSAFPLSMPRFSISIP